MISVQCPHCHVGLKVDESKLPANIQTFACPKCKNLLSVSSVLSSKRKKEGDSETELLSPICFNQTGKLIVVENQLSPAQTIYLSPGVNIIGRKSTTSNTPTSIQTADRQMSRSHIIIDVIKDKNNRYKHYLSDNKSINQTLYNNNCLEQGETIILKDKDEILIGQTLLIFEEEPFVSM